jgi:hypothetical protein
MTQAPAGGPPETTIVAIAVTSDWLRVSGHAGQARHWLVFDCVPGRAIPAPRRITLEQAQLAHHFRDDGPHPLREVPFMVAASAGDGFIRHMARWGAQVLLTGETDPVKALEGMLAGEVPPDTRFDITTALCKLRDLFSRY